MPPKPVDYSKVVIYKIVCNDLDVTDCYVGHTTDFKSRKNQHKFSCKCKDFKIYKSIRDNGGWDNWTMIEVEKYPCNDGNEARAKEREWYESLCANLNSEVPNRNRREYEEANKQKINQYKKKYAENHKEQIKEYNKEYYGTNKEHITERQKKYDEANKEHKKEYSKEYRENNREKVNARRRELYRLKKEMRLN